MWQPTIFTWYLYIYIYHTTVKKWKLQQLAEPETHLTDTEAILFPDYGFSYTSSLFIFSVKIQLCNSL